MFDAHRHMSLDYQQSRNALYATANMQGWQQLKSLKGEAVGGLGALAGDRLPDICSLEQELVIHTDYQVSEVGLDRRFGNMEQQIQFLDEVLQLSYTLRRSVTLHCVQATSELLKLLRERKSSLPPLLWHGFTSSYETALEASRLQVILSFGPRLYKSKLAKEGKKLIAFPYALETDFENADEGKYQPLLQEHIQNFCALSSTTEEQLIRNNDEIRTILTNQ